MKRTTSLVAALVLAATFHPMTASANGLQIGTAIHAHIDRDTCRFARYDGHVGVSDVEVRKMMRCAQLRWPVLGGLDKAFAVVRCESGFDETNVNPKSGAAGVWQFLASTWSSQRAHYRRLGRRFKLSTHVLNARANVVVGMRYAHEGGWGPWQCA